jgi:hypothetical protein
MEPRWEERLGPMLREHRARQGAPRAFLVAGLSALALAVAAALFAVGRALFAYQTYGPLAIERWMSAPAVAAGGFLVAGVAILALGRGRPRVIVRRHARGLVLERGRRGSAIPWDEVREVRTASVRYGLGPLPWGRQEQMTLVTRDGRTFHLDHSLSEYEELVSAVKHSVYPMLLDAYTRAFNHGQTLPFGPLSLAPDGIQNGRKTMPWNQVNQVRLDHGWLEAAPTDSKSGLRLRFPARSIPNVDLCLQLIQELSSQP